MLHLILAGLPLACFDLFDQGRELMVILTWQPLRLVEADRCDYLHGALLQPSGHDDRRFQRLRTEIGHGFTVASVERIAGLQ